MPARLITYDLSKPGQDYSDLHDAIKGIGTWWHCLESTWIVITDATPAQVRDHLTGYLDADDSLVVFNLSGGWASYNLSEECADWLQSNI